jgi:hypothetical protein
MQNAQGDVAKQNRAEKEPDDRKARRREVRKKGMFLPSRLLAFL